MIPQQSIPLPPVIRSIYFKPIYNILCVCESFLCLLASGSPMFGYSETSHLDSLPTSLLFATYSVDVLRLYNFSAHIISGNETSVSEMMSLQIIPISDGIV